MLHTLSCNRIFKRNVSLFAVSIFLLPVFAHAGNLYVYRSQDGTTLLTNKRVNNKGYVQEKVTYYADTNVHRYSNWGNSEASVLPSFSKSKNAYDDIIRSAAQLHGVSEGLVKAVMHTESSFNSQARSPVGAQGLMQLMPATARRFNVSNAFDPTQNIHGGAKYLSWLLKRFKGDTALALAAYNAGEGNVTKYGGIPPFRETQNYVRSVLSRYQNLYTGGLSASNSSNKDTSSYTQVSTRLNQNNSNESTQLSVSSMPRREIVYNNGTYTDRAVSRTYATNDAVVTSNIQISH